jgi:ABC-type transport system involved in Fe-S cluster assembly fused permease/ATPase subunit
MAELCAGRTTVVIAHRLTTVRDADHTYVLRNGRIVETGSHSELIAQGGYYRDLYNRNVL